MEISLDYRGKSPSRETARASELPTHSLADGRSSSACRERDARPAASPKRLAPGEALARLAHERHGLGEHGGHHAADLLGLLLRRALDVDPVDRRDGHVDRELDRVVGPGEALRALK